MALNSINTNVAAYFAQSNIGKASEMASSSIARLSSGDRIVRASDDVAAMSAGTSLRTNVTTLRMALVNTSQGSSLLQVADGALSQVTDILQRQKAISVQAGAGSLTNQERSFLNQEFTNLTEEIDRLVGQTNFNGVSLLDGSLSEVVDVTDVTTQGDAASMTLTLSENVADGAQITLNGVTLTGEANVGSVSTGEFQVGATAAQTIANLADTLNNIETNSNFTSAQKLALSEATYEADGNTLIIKSRAGGELGESFKLDMNSGALAERHEISFGANYGAGEDFIYSGVTLTEGADFDTEATLGETLVNLAAAANADATLGAEAVFSAVGDTLVVTRLASAAMPGDYTTTPTGDVTTTLATIESQASVGGANGYSEITMLGTGIATTSEDLVNGAGSLTAEVDGVTYTIATLADNDSLADVARSINANTSTTGIAAELYYDQAAGLYNVRLSHDNALDSVGDITLALDTSTLDSGALNTTATTTTQQAIYTLDGGTDSGLGIGRTEASGVIGNDILTGQVANKAKSVISFPEIADADLLTSANFGGSGSAAVRINVGNQDFVFSTTDLDDKAGNEIKIGATLEETLDNAVATINSYVGNGGNNFELNQISVHREGREIIIESRDVANVLDTGGSATQVTLTNLSTASVSSGTLDNSDTGGVITSAISNKDFIGSVSGFEATYTSSDTVDVSIKVGEYTYTAQSVDTTATSDTTVRLYSDTLADGSNGGYFDIEMAANKGETVSNQVGADTFADRLDAALGSINFYQKHEVSSYDGKDAIVTNGAVTGSLIGTSLDIQLDDFSDVKIESVSVKAPEGVSPNGSVSIQVNGDTYTTSPEVGSTLAANQTYTLTSTADASKFIEFTTGDVAIDFGTDTKAASFETALKESLGVGNGDAKLNFQVGTTTSDTLAIGINNINTDTLFGGETLNVLTAEAAANAGDVIDAAIKIVTSVRAEVGALQSRFEFAAANVENSIQNQDAARGTLLDTDISAESTDFATAQVQLQAGIAVLAQANQLPQNLLKLIG